MSDKELVEELRERAAHDATGSNVAQCMREAANALEARQPGGIDRDAAIDAISGGTISVPGGYGVLHGDDAANIVDAIIGQAAVPDAATAESERRAWAIAGHLERDREALKAERDAALAAVERVRVLAFDHGKGAEDLPVVRDALKAALDGAPEPEWEWADRLWGEKP